MSFSSGTRSLMSDALGWAGVALVAVYGITHFEEIRSFAHEVMGTAPMMATASDASDGAAEAGDAETAAPASGTVELKAADNGHYHTQAEVNGREIEVMVDTGASMVALTWEDAQRAGIYLDDSDFTHRVSTANGISRVAPVTLSKVTIGDITVRNVQAAVCERDKLQTTLLGMSFLSRLDKFEMRSGTLVMQN